MGQKRSRVQRPLRPTTRPRTAIISCFVSLFGLDHLLPKANQKANTTRIPYKYRVSQEECARLRESVPYVKVYRYNAKHLYPKLNGYGDNDQRSLKL